MTVVNFSKKIGRLLCHKIYESFKIENLIVHLYSCSATIDYSIHRVLATTVGG